MLITMKYKEDLIIKLLNEHKDPYKVKTILLKKYKINMDMKSLCKRLPIYVYNIKLTK